MSVHIEPNNRVVNIGGRWMRDVEITIPDEWLDRIAKGYMCISCFEPFTEAYPDRCGTCGYEVSRDQRADFDRLYRGKLEHDVPDLDDSIERSQEYYKYRARKSGIWVP